MNTDRIYLIGYMGAGKTTVGRLLAERLGFRFIDLDKYIENKYFKTISSLFAERGETEFRKLEQKALYEVSEMEKVIVATGGGAPCFFENMNLMNISGTTVYMMVAPEELSRRLLVSKTVRPIIAGKTPDELASFISRHLAERELFYKKAHIVYETLHPITKQEVHLTAEGIARQLKKRLL